MERKRISFSYDLKEDPELIAEFKKAPCYRNYLAKDYQKHQIE